MNKSEKYLNPKNDVAFKKLFGSEDHKNIPKAFLNAVFNLKGKDRITNLRFLETNQRPEIAVRKREYCRCPRSRSKRF